MFWAYYTPAGRELDALSTEGIIAPDTNTLVNSFRCTPSTRDEALSVRESLRASLRVPYRVDTMFQRRLVDVISNTADAFSKIKNSADTAKKYCHKKLNEYKRHPSVEEELREATLAFDELKN